MEVVRSAGPIYRFTMIPASRVALVSSIQVNDRGKAAPAVPYRRSDLVLWPTAEMTVAGPSVGNWRKFRHHWQAWLTMVGGATVARARRPLPRKAAVASDIVWCL
jgi:hypothetical protein